MANEGLSICESGWNEEMLKDIHRALMGEMYDWAGEYRTVDVGIAADNVKYMPPEEVKSKLKETFAFINRNNCFIGMEQGERIRNLALVFGNLKNAQPFRDGNTRTAMVFTQLLAGAAGDTVDFNFFAKDVDENGKEGEELENFRLAQVAARDGNYHYLTLCFSQMVFPVEERPELAMPRVEVGKQGDLLTTLKKMTGEIPALCKPKRIVLEAGEAKSSDSVSDERKEEKRTENSPASMAYSFADIDSGSFRGR